MGRIRTIKPEFHSHEELSALPAETHLLAGALTNYADDEGYFNANPGLVRAGTHPLRDDPTPIVAQLAQLLAMGYIEIHSCADGKMIGRIVNFNSHQKVSHPSESRLKQRFNEGSRKPPENYVKPPESLRPDQGTGNGIEQGTGNREASTAVAVPASPTFIALPLTGKKFHIITQADVVVYEQSYPAVDVSQQLREVCVWLDAHPDKCSQSVNGSKQRIARWLGKEQDKGGSTHGNTNGKQRNFADIANTSRGALELLGDMDTPAYLGGGGAQARPHAGQILEGADGPALAADAQRNR
jgi:hypothetical protein